MQKRGKMDEEEYNAHLAVFPSSDAYNNKSSALITALNLPL